MLQRNATSFSSLSTGENEDEKLNEVVQEAWKYNRECKLLRDTLQSFSWNGRSLNYAFPQECREVFVFRLCRISGGWAGAVFRWSRAGEWVEYCGTGVNPAVITQAYLDNLAFSLIFQSSNELCVADSLLSRAPITYHLGKKKASDLRTPSRYLSC